MQPLAVVEGHRENPNVWKCYPTIYSQLPNNNIWALFLIVIFTFITNVLFNELLFILFNDNYVYL